MRDREKKKSEIKDKRKKRIGYQKIVLLDPLRS